MQRHLFAAAVVPVFWLLFFLFTCGNATSLSRWKRFVIVLLVNAFPTASFYLSVHLFLSFPPCPLCNMGMSFSHFQLHSFVWEHLHPCSRRKELENSPQCILHSFSLTTPLFAGFPDAALPAARSVPEHLHEAGCRRNAQQNKAQFSRSSRRGAAAGWREAFQEK